MSVITSCTYTSLISSFRAVLTCSFACAIINWHTDLWTVVVVAVAVLFLSFRAGNSPNRQAPASATRIYFCALLLVHCSATRMFDCIEMLGFSKADLNGQWLPICTKDGQTSYTLNGWQLYYDPYYGDWNVGPFGSYWAYAYNSRSTITTGMRSWTQWWDSQWQTVTVTITDCAGLPFPLFITVFKYILLFKRCCVKRKHTKMIC